MKNAQKIDGCCGVSTDSGNGLKTTKDREGEYWQDFGLGKGHISTVAGEIPIVSTKLTLKDLAGSGKARWGINRLNYKIRPGLYCLGNPDKESPVLVSANYKMSFDRLRKELGGIDAWIMVLDTKGINVWCSAGKGTFGTDEIVKRIEKVGLTQIVSHRKLILPQLGAPGVAAHEVSKQSGFKVIYGPIRARDIPPFIKAGMKASPKMRTVNFSFLDRLTLTPMELVGAVKPVSIILGVLLVLSLLGLRVFSIGGIAPFIGAILVGSVLVPAFLPWIPGRAFAFKGWLMGIIWALAVNIHYGWLFSSSPSWKQSLVNFLLLPAIASFMTLNFTGSSTYTSLSGVVREMKIALPLIIISASLGLTLMIVKLFVSF